MPCYMESKIPIRNLFFLCRKQISSNTTLDGVSKNTYSYYAFSHLCYMFMQITLAEKILLARVVINHISNQTHKTNSRSCEILL